jgi:putative transcriptional regulator
MKKQMKIDVGAELIEGMENAVAHARGAKAARREAIVRVRVPENINVRRIRTLLRMSQAEFAARFGFSIKNVQNWEQGERQPEGPARAYLTVIEREPKAVERALSAA